MVARRTMLLLGLAALRLVTMLSAPPQLQGGELADLEVYAVRLTDRGSVIYQVANRGKGSTEHPFVVEIYVNGTRRDTIRHDPLAGLTIQTAESNLARLAECIAATVAVVVDAQNGVAESDKANNQRIAQLTPACARSPQSRTPDG